MQSIIMAMKVFKYKFTKVTTILIYAGIFLCALCVGLNIFSIVTSDLSSSANIVYPVIQYTLMFLIPLVLAVILVSLLVSSYYSIDEKWLKTSFGVIKSKYDLKDIKTLLLDRTTNKLSVYFNNESFIVIVVKEDWYDDFIDALCSANDKIEFTINSKENKKDDEEKK